MSYRFSGKLPDDDRLFMDLIKAVCLGEIDDEPWNVMLQPEHIERTYKAIIDFKNRVMAALSRYNAELATVGHYENKKLEAEAKRDILSRKGAMLRLHRRVEEKVLEAKMRRREVARQAQENTSAAANGKLRERIGELEAALRLALTYVDPRYRDSPDVAQAHVVLEAGGAWWHYADAALDIKMERVKGEVSRHAKQTEEAV